MAIRVGHGFDVHRFDVESTAQQSVSISLGGVTIPSEWQLLAHSDGDVLIHALCDALLGAVGEGDIGEHFPDTDEQFKDADSRVLLRRVFERLQQSGWSLLNADLTLIAQTPQISPHKTKMVVNLAQDLSCSKSQINIKATTTEGLGYTGRKEGIACHAVVLLEQD